MSRINSRVILPAVMVLIGAAWAGYGLTQYGWWGENGPQSGFFPAIVGVTLMVVSILAVVDGLRKGGPKYVPASFHPLLAVVGVVLAAFLISFFPALAIFIFVWVRFYEKYRWTTALTTTAVTVALFYGVFSLWLRVPFPDGIIFDAIGG